MIKPDTSTSRVRPSVNCETSNPNLDFERNGRS